MAATARMRRVSAHILRAAPAADESPVRAGGENGIPFERWAVGQQFYTTRRTISDSDISTFVQVAGFQVRVWHPLAPFDAKLEGALLFFLTAECMMRTFVPTPRRIAGCHGLKRARRLRICLQIWNIWRARGTQLVWHQGYSLRQLPMP